MPLMTPAREKAIRVAQEILLQDPLFLDTETTGLDRNAEIIEIAVVDNDDTVIIETLVRPSRPIPPSATAIHGITNDQTGNSQTWPILWQTLRNRLTNRLIIAYNADFDLKMMKQSMEAYRLPWRDKLEMFCAMKLYAEYRGEWDPRSRSNRLCSLETAREQQRVVIPNSHRAADDARLVRALMRSMAESVTI
jgi:DNA polymerase III subunit epsilon